ncbi:transporter [Flavimarina sp. Hel_I_48]|uniref:transporter n=1 Tax=Flavimarina sp. Hel_I_48 TaxID=1392488 RepID=UPI000A6164CE|nr:transporter [Flavimarina sp. Hel_I_48]
MNQFKYIKTNYFLIVTLFTWLSMSANTPLDSIAATTVSHYTFEDDCDVCGCGGSGGSMGYGTVGNGNFVGLRYIYQQYRSKDGIFNNSPWIDENFNTLQVWAQIPISDKISVNAIVPYHFHNREFNDGSGQNINGLGDISVLGFYNLISPRIDGLFPQQQYILKHNLQVGAGIKLPTGDYKRENNTGSVNPSFQLGTGSLDVVLAGNYSISHNEWGAGVLANYTFKTENQENYQFGNQFNYGFNIYRTFTTMKMRSFTPVVGLAGEVYETNKSFGLDVAKTAGNILFTRLGVETNIGKFSGGINLMLPLAQELNDGNVAAKSRLGIHLNFII